eukprot:s6898_g3.t1
MINLLLPTFLLTKLGRPSIALYHLVGGAPAHDNGRRLTGPGPSGAAIQDALGPEAFARIASDVFAIAQGVAGTQADLEILRNGVSDVAETLEGKIRDMWDHIQAELRSERIHQQHVSDVARERRIADHETIEDRFERMTSAINERLVEFDQRIYRMNEDRAGSISLELQEAIRMIKRYPDALMQININVSNAEARIGAVEQNATHRIEVIRTEMSRALHDNKERTDRIIDQLTARIAQLEAGHANKTASDRSTPIRHDRAQFFDISDHSSDVPWPADLPPVPGSLFPEHPGSTIPRSSLLGPIDHGSPPGCNAAPAEKASTVQSQASCLNLEPESVSIRNTSSWTVDRRGHDNLPDRFLGSLPKGRHIFRADLPKRQFQPQIPQT